MSGRVARIYDRGVKYTRQPDSVPVTRVTSCRQSSYEGHTFTKDEDVNEENPANWLAGMHAPAGTNYYVHAKTGWWWGFKTVVFNVTEEDFKTAKKFLLANGARTRGNITSR